MTTKNSFKAVSTLAAVAMALFAVSAHAGQLQGQLGILTPETLAANNPATGAPWAPGDQYRFVFHTSEKTTAQSADISTYNTWVQGLANVTTAYDIGADDGATWKAIGSTDTVDARDNTATNPTVNGSGHAIFLLDGSTIVANDYEDLWDGEIQHIIDITEQGTQWAHWPWSGSYWDGTKAPGHGTSFGALGDNVSNIHQGCASETTQWIWRTWTGDPPDTLLPMYALSDPLVIIGQTDPNIPDVDAGADVITWSGEPVALDPNVVEKAGSDWTSLTYAWTAEPLDGVEFSNPYIKAPTVTITKTTDNPSIVTLTLAVNNEGRIEPPVTDAMTIDVYDNSCLAAIDLGQVVFDPTDLNQDCITDFADFALMAETWLDDYTPTAPEPK